MTIINLVRIHWDYPFRHYLFDLHFVATPDSMYENSAYAHSVSSSNLSDRKPVHSSNNDENISDDEQVSPFDMRKLCVQLTYCY